MNLSKINTEELSEEFMDRMISELNLCEMDEKEARCIVYAWLLKTCLYMVEETSHEWSDTGRAVLDHELEVINQ